MENLFEVAYNSDLIIRDSSEAATLCVFYDRVLLPHTNRESSKNLIGQSGIREEFVNEIPEWDLKYGTLFDQGVLRRLPDIPGSKRIVRKERVRTYLEYPRNIPHLYLVHDGKAAPLESVGAGRDDNGYYFEFGQAGPDARILKSLEVFVNAWNPRLGRRTQKEHKCRLLTVREFIPLQDRDDLDIAVDLEISNLLAIHVDKYESGGKPLIRLDLARHLLRTDIQVPQIFSMAPGRLSSDVLVALQATATFRYLLPKIHTFHPTQILELRERVRDTREGFTMHLWALSKGLQERAKDGTSLSDAAKFAQDMIKSELIPDYCEFRRQLSAMRTEKWGKVLDAAGKIAEIDAAPWTPKFWALVLKALGIAALKSQSERSDALSNRYQAFAFMSYVEESSLKL